MDVEFRTGFSLLGAGVCAQNALAAYGIGPSSGRKMSQQVPLP